MFKKLLLLTLAGFLLLSSWGCDSFRKPEMKFIKTEISSITFEKINFNVIYEVDNPNPIAINEVSAGYQLFLKDKPFVSGEKKSSDLPSQSTTPFILTFSVRYADLFDGVSGLVSAISSGQKSIPYQFKGNLKSKVTFIDINIPFENQGEIPLPEIPKEQIQKQIQNEIQNQLKNIKLN